MTPTKAKEQRADARQDSRRHSELDQRYGEIGISAVAAAVRCKGEEPRRREATKRKLSYQD